MTYLQPCFNCATDKATCTRRAQILQGLRGLGVGSVKFKCAERQSRFRHGQRVEFNWRYYEPIDDYGGAAEYHTTFRGTIMREKPNNRRFSIRVDQEGEDYDLKPAEVFNNPEFISVRPDDIRPLDEPDRAICPNCAAYEDHADMERLGCWARGQDDVPKGCHS